MSAFATPDLVAIAQQAMGNFLIVLGRSDEGFGLLDEAMVAVTAGELSPVVTGLVYCGAIEGCHEAYELRRAREWTGALTGWCEQQPEMVAFTGRCLVHRAEIMQLEGAWDEALAEAERAGGRAGMSGAGIALAHYRRGDLLRLRGEFAAAEEAYREASRCGREPQPGMALLRLAQRNAKAAAATIRRAVDEGTEPSRRIALLPAYVEIMLAVDALEDARRGCASSRRSPEATRAAWSGRWPPMPAARSSWPAAIPRPPLRPCVGRWRPGRSSALPTRPRARACWSARLPGARGRGRCRHGAGCGPDRIRGAGGGAGSRTGEQARRRRQAGLTGRELEVLRLVAAGNTNRAIAGELVLSERTVDRHVSNIYAKLDVPSRAAATAYAYEHGLI